MERRTLMNMNYQSPEIEMLAVESEDIISTSYGILLPLDPATEAEI